MRLLLLCLILAFSVSTAHAARKSRSSMPVAVKKVYSMPVMPSCKDGKCRIAR